MIAPTDRVLSFKELQYYVPACRSTIWRWMKISSFPKNKRIGPGRKIGWLESEVQEWIASR